MNLIDTLQQKQIHNIEYRKIVDSQVEYIHKIIKNISQTKLHCTFTPFCNEISVPYINGSKVNVVNVAKDIANILIDEGFMVILKGIQLWITWDIRYTGVKEQSQPNKKEIKVNQSTSIEQEIVNKKKHSGSTVINILKVKEAYGVDPIPINVDKPISL